MIASNGCSLYGKKQIVQSDYCEKYYSLPQNEDIKKDITKISESFYEYVKINETTKVCDCLAKNKQECYQQFLDLENEQARNTKKSSTKR